jgi:hypothetical protein
LFPVKNLNLKGFPVKNLNLKGFETIELLIQTHTHTFPAWPFLGGVNMEWFCEHTLLFQHTKQTIRPHEHHKVLFIFFGQRQFVQTSECGESKPFHSGIQTNGYDILIELQMPFEL